MSYQVLARKWRPKSFDTLIGQEHVVRALTNALKQQRLHHAYLLTGTRGVGKTTIARILPNHSTARLVLQPILAAFAPPAWKSTKVVLLI